MTRRPLFPLACLGCGKVMYVRRARGYCSIFCRWQTLRRIMDAER